MGYPLPKGAGKKEVGRAVKAELGYGPDDTVWLLKCDDSRIVRIATECRLNGHDSSTDIGKRLGEPEALVERIRRLHDNPSGRWLLGGNGVAVSLHVLAAQNGGYVTVDQACEVAKTSAGNVHTTMYDLRATGIWTSLRKRGYLLAACDCGSLQRAPSRLREVDGPICLNCRRDLSGVPWPCDPYDGYLAYPDRWDPKAPDAE